MVRLEAEASTAPLKVVGPMTFERAGELRQLLLESVEQQRSCVEVDLADVTELDCSGVQLLLLARRSALAAGKELQLVGQSLIVLQTLEFLRLHQHFGPPEFVLLD